MKKIRGIVLGLIFAVASVNGYAAECGVTKGNSLFNAMIAEGETSYISVRELAHLIGGEIKWNNRSKAAILTGYGESIKVVADSNVAANQGHAVTWLQHTTFIREGYLYIAVEDIESLLQIKIVNEGDVLGIMELKEEEIRKVD